MVTEQYIKRTIEPILLKYTKGFPAVMVTGPRQSGKTTLLRNALGDTYGYITLDRLEDRDQALSDPVGFLQAHPPPVIFDEIQYAPQLLSEIKFRIDENRRAMGQYILTGSQNLILLEKVTETLAGRVGIIKLLPLSGKELRGVPDDPLPWERKDRVSRASHQSMIEVAEGLLQGGFPERALPSPLSNADWFSSYVGTYIERDVRHVRQIHDLPLFQRFMRLLATRSGQLVNYASLGHDLGITNQTVRDWMAILLVTHHVVLLPPYFANIGKSLTKTCKLYFTDTGLLCHLLGIESASQLLTHAAAGAIFETAVFAELYKSFLNRGREPRLYFWRTEAGSEVDFILEVAGRLIPVEVKFTATSHVSDAKAIRQFTRDLAGMADPGWVIHAGERSGPFGEGVWGVPVGVV